MMKQQLVTVTAWQGVLSKKEISPDTCITQSNPSLDLSFQTRGVMFSCSCTSLQGGGRRSAGLYPECLHECCMLLESSFLKECWFYRNSQNRLLLGEGQGGPSSKEEETCSCCQPSSTPAWEWAKSTLESDGTGWTNWCYWTQLVHWIWRPLQAKAAYTWWIPAAHSELLHSGGRFGCSKGVMLFSCQSNNSRTVWKSLKTDEKTVRVWPLARTPGWTHYRLTGPECNPHIEDSSLRLTA